MVLVAVACLTTAATAQSIMVSGGRPSVFVSGTGQQEATKPAAPKPPAERPPAAPQPEVITPPVVVQQERWLVSESWCPHCPAAKRRFLQSGGRADHVITIAQALQMHGRTITSIPVEYTTGAVVQAPQPVPTRRVRSRLPVVRTQWGTIDLETYRRNCNCPMCQGIRALQQQYRQQSQYKEAAQEPTPTHLISQMINLMDLQSDDVLCDLGCGDGRILIAAAKKTGCRGIGVEIDPEKANEARVAVAAAGLSDQIRIVTGDALTYDLAGNGVTALVTYLYPELLQKLSGKYADVRVGASPFHEVPGVEMTRHGDIWLYRS